MLRRIITAGLLLAWGASESVAEKAWRVKENCTLIENPSNDGDSFHVRVNKRHYIFRLLFVDCPESETSLPERLQEQAAYWGIPVEAVPKLGKQAAKFSADFLKEPFTVFTQFDDAMGRSDKDRDYALITGAKGQDLGVALVEQGLARIHGLQETPDDGPSVSTMRMRLKTAENEAKKNKRGAWALVGGSPATPGAFTPAADTKPITEQTLTISRSTPVYSLVNPGQTIGYLTAGKEITVLKAETPAMVRIRFNTNSGQTYEAQVRRTDLGL